MERIWCRSPAGLLELASEGGALVSLRFAEEGSAALQGCAAMQGSAACCLVRGEVSGSPVLAEAVRQLDLYFRGELTAFDLPLAPAGTPFQLAVWKALRDIPYGSTESYSGIAEAVGRPRAVRAVGQANHRNPIPIIIPCHRVVGRDGSLTGYAGGLALKRLLLSVETSRAGS